MSRPITAETGVKGRLLQFIEHKKLSKHRFEMMCGFSSRYVSNINKTISPRSLKIISEVFPDLNTHWVATGEGRMLNEVIPINVHNNTVGNNSSQTIVAGRDNSTSIIDENGQQIIEKVRKMQQENLDLKAENSSLKTKVEMLTEQVEWLRTLIKQQN